MFVADQGLGPGSEGRGGVGQAGMPGSNCEDMEGDKMRHSSSISCIFEIIPYLQISKKPAKRQNVIYINVLCKKQQKYIIYCC